MSDEDGGKRRPGGGAVPARRRRLVLAGAALAAILVAGGLGSWWAGLLPASLRPEPAATQATAPPATDTAATRAAIAVLPLVSLSGDGGSDYFADGLTEDIITALGHFPELSVMSRGAVFAYKDKNPGPRAVGRQLKVRYVVEGSIRRTSDRIRVSVTLTDTMRSVLLWSEQYDAEPKDIFAVQDQITRRITGALAVRLTSLELARSETKPPGSLEAYDLVLRGRDLLSRLTRPAHAEARTDFEHAIALDPDYAPAYIGLGRVELSATTQGWTPDPSAALERTESLARKAIELDELSSGAHALLGSASVYFGDYDRGLGELKRAIELNRSDAESYSGLLSVLLWRGDIPGAIATGEFLSQFEPELAPTDAFHLATACVLADRAPDAIRVLEQSLDRNRMNLFTNTMLAAAHAAVGRRADATRQADMVRQRFDGLSRDQVGSLMRDPAERDKLALALRKAGF